MLRYVIRPGDGGRSVQWVAIHALQVSRGMLSRMKFSGGILLDGVRCRTTQTVLPGQVLTLTEPAPRRAFPLPPGDACAGALDIVYEDADYLAVNKPAPLPAMASRKGGPALQGLVFLHMGQPEGFVYRPVNRLDSGTSGLMLIAKSAHAQQLMQRQLLGGAVARGYLVIVMGCPEPRSGVIRLPIGHGPGTRRMVDPSGRACVTQYAVERSLNGVSLLRITLETGRTHQIRVHMSALGCPVMGDYLYGQADPRLPGRFALHAHMLAFDHPVTGGRIALESPLPGALSALINA